MNTHNIRFYGKKKKRKILSCYPLLSGAIRFLTAVVQTSLGSHVGKPSSAYRWSGGFFPGFSGFRPPLMNDQLDISEIFLKGP